MEREVIIDTEEIKEFFYERLIERGFAPGEDECEELADIVFDFLVDKGVVEEEI